MSRHSKWAQIKNQKAATDKKKGKLFSILSKRISIAARAGANPEMNPALKLAIAKAKEANMGGSTIERAIKRGLGELQGQGAIEEVVYEAYGPGGLQLVIVASTENRNRTISSIRHIIEENGGSLSGQGSVMWNFERRGDEFIPKTTQSADDNTKAKIELLIDKLTEDEDVEEVYTNLNAKIKNQNAK